MAEQENHVGRQVGNYRLTHLLGKGGFAQVYLATHLHLKTQVAVKLLLHAHLGDEEVESFRQEAQTIAGLIHPHIVRVLDFGVQDGLPYLVMDYAPNGTLRQRYSKGTRLPLPAAVSYVKQVALALQYAHDQRLIHRDVKPENMLVGRNQEVLLSDFGIALSAQSSYSHARDIAGTIPYMAPEQIKAHPRPASDQYALGIVTYEWLCGTRPFTGSYTEIAVKHTLVQPQPLREHMPSLPVAVEQVVLKALTKEPASRFASVLAFAEALEQASQPRATFPFASSVSLPPSPPTMPLMPTMFAPSPSAPITYVQSPTTFSTTPALDTSGARGPVTSSIAAPYSNFPMLETRRVRRSLSRRATIAGLAGLTGLALAGGGFTWLMHSQATAPLPLTIKHSSSSQTVPSQAVPSQATQKSPADPTASSPILLQGHRGTINALAWSPDGKHIASAAADGTARVWNAATGELLHTFSSQRKPQYQAEEAKAVAWSRDSQRITVGFMSAVALVWDVASGKIVVTYGDSPSYGAVLALAWSADEKALALVRANLSDQVQVYDAASATVSVVSQTHMALAVSVAWSPDGTRFVSGSWDGTASVCRSTDGKLLINYAKHTAAVDQVAWSHDGTRIASCSYDGTVQVWNPDSGSTLLTYKEQPKAVLFAVAWSPDDHYIASGGGSNVTRVWDARTKQVSSSFDSYVGAALAWSPDGKHLVTGGVQNTAKVWQFV